MADYIETMAYRFASNADVPWHGLGNPVDNNMSTDEMLDAAGLNWEVVKQPNYFLVPGTGANGIPTKMRIVPGEYSLVRNTDLAYLDTVGENYKIPQNRDILEFFRRFVEAGDMTMETAGSIKGGKFIWALARINESFSLGKGDETRGYLLLSQPHQFGYSMTAALTPIRVVCWNTINIAQGINKETGENTIYKNSFRMTHAREFDDSVKSEIERTLGLAQEGMKAFNHTAQLLSGVRAKDESVTEYFHRIMQLEVPEEGLPEDADLVKNRTVKRFREALTEAPGQDLFRDTWWNAFNATTYTVDHVMSRNADNRLHSAWYGRGAILKRRALDLAVEYAEAD